MPAIRKIRIVNFRFNDGSKLIPDEIFCTEDADGKPIDTLLNLDNGGGKSVIVQLLLQPVCPKAKVQDRSISEYFQKGTDHAFILIEWALDGSSNSLLTGIAMAASTTADDENESRTVRYYTFMHVHSGSGDKLDLIRLPLTERTGSHIRPMSFEDLRKYLKSRKIECYTPESLRRYQKLLEEYGILHTEWENILVRINSVEGGITKYFEDYHTADRLLDRFIIPGVMPNDKASAEELEDMFVNYADSYAGQEDNLRLQSQIKSFTEKLQGILPLMKDMWDSEDARLRAIRLLADHLFTLDHDIGQDSGKLAQLRSTIDGLKAKLHHIKAEKASEAFYLAEEGFENAERQLAECTREKEDAEARRDKLAHTVSVLNAAKEYAELTELQNDEKALTAQIRELDKGTQDSRILSLRYSLYLAAADAEKHTEAELARAQSARKEHSDEYSKAQETISRLNRQYTDENNGLNQMKGRRDYLHEQIDKGLNELGLQITFMLNGVYSKEEIENIRSGYEKLAEQTAAKIDSCLSEERLLGQELDAQDTERSELANARADCRSRSEQERSALARYKEAYDAVIPVLEHLSVPASRLFTDEPLTSLDNILAKLKEQLKQAERSAELLAEQARCIEAGQLHLSKTAADLLQSSGVSYQTGEQYLHYQQPGIREDILSANPLTAYAVIVDSEKDRQKLLPQTEDSWLSAIVPVYTRSEVADMADGKWEEHHSFLSAFDKDYFSDVSAYKENIRRRLDEAKAETGHLRHQIGEWRAERDILSRFTYPADTEEQLRKNIAACDSELESINDKLAALDRRKAEIKKRTEELHKLIKAGQDTLRSTENKQKEFRRICAVITQYEELSVRIVDTEALCRKLCGQIDDERREESRLAELIRECDDKIRLLGEELTKYQALLTELKDAPQAAVLTEDFSAMLAEYRLYQEDLSADLRRLREKLQKVQDSARNKAKGIKRFHVEQSEYENAAYSDEAYHRAEEQLSIAQADSDKASGQYSKAVKSHAKAESLLEQARTRLSELIAEPLPRSEVGSDHERRIAECLSALGDSEQAMQECTERLNELNAERKYAAKYAERFEKEYAGYRPGLSAERQNTNKLRDAIEDSIERLKRSESKTKNYHRSELEPFRDTHPLFTGTLDGIISVIDDHSITGDKYFTLYERTEGDIRRYQDRIAQLAVLLKDVEDSRKQLVTNCLQRVGRLYENLTMLSKKSTVQIGNSKKQMIRIELPVIDPTSEQPAERIDRYITEQVKKHLSEQGASGKTRHGHLEIRRLLNCYIGTESIPITVFKIDKNIRNSRYRSWQDALKANSGGEQFVVLFSLIVSVMNYTRSLSGSLSTASGVLILDNPFGPISSPHLLEPMFSMARHFHIQLICLTHLGTAAVTSLFDMVYQLRFRNLPLSSVEILESAEKQHMEHAYYRAEQLSLF